MILGNGNCLFIAVAHIIYGSEDKHATVHQTLIIFTFNYRPVLLNYITSEPFEEHIETVTIGKVIGTHVKLHAAASYYQLPVYICSPHPQTNNYMYQLVPEQCVHLCYGETCTLPQTNRLGHYKLHSWFPSTTRIISVQDPDAEKSSYMYMNITKFSPRSTKLQLHRRSNGRTRIRAEMAA